MPLKLFTLLLCGALGYFGQAILRPGRRDPVPSYSNPSPGKATPAPGTVSPISATPFTEEQLAKAMESAGSWAATSQRLALTRAVFRQIAQREGSVAAISSACSRFEASPVSGPARDSAIEVAILSALEVDQPPDSDLATLLASHATSHRPFLLAIAFTHAQTPLAPRYERLRAISSPILTSLNEAVEAALIDAALAATGNIQLPDLLALASVVDTHLTADHATTGIAQACRSLDPDLATDFLLERWKKQPAKTGDLARRLAFSRNGLVELYRKLPAEDRGAFVSGYFPDYENFPSEMYANLADVIPPQDLSMDARKRILSGLWFSGSGYVSAWLKQLPESEKGPTLNAGFPAVHGLPVYQCLRDWLTATEGVQGIDPKLLGQTVGDLSRSIPLAAALPYTERLAPAEKKNALFLMYSLNIGKSASKGLSDMLAIAASAPPDLTGPLRFSVYDHFARAAPADALRLWMESGDPSVKGAIERAFTQIGDRLPSDVRETWINSVVADPNRLNKASPAVNDHVVDLLWADSAAALKYAENLPASPLREAALLNLATRWAQADPPSASEWIVDLPPGDTRDQSLAVLIKATPDQPSEAITNSLGIANQKLRLDALQAVVKWWGAYNTAPIRSAIEASGLSAPEKQTLLGQLSPAPPKP